MKDTIWVRHMSTAYESAGESLHADFDRHYHGYQVKDINATSYQKKLLHAIKTYNERVRIEEKRFLLYADALFIRLMEHSLFIFSPRRFLSSHCYDDVFCPSILFCALVMKKTCCCTDDLCFLNPRRAKIAGSS